MNKTDCTHLVREGICGANLDACCIYQNAHKYPCFDPHWDEIHSLKECWCDYPNVAASPELETAIRTIAKYVYGEKNPPSP